MRPPTQRDRVFRVLVAATIPLTLQEIGSRANVPPASASARIREIRSDGYQVKVFFQSESGVNRPAKYGLVNP